MANGEKKPRMKYVVNWETFEGEYSHPETKTVVKFDLKVDLPNVTRLWGEFDEIERHIIVFGHRQCPGDSMAGEKVAENKMAALYKRRQKLFIDRTLSGTRSADDKVRVDKNKVKAKARELAAKFGLTEERAEEMAMELLS